MAHPDAANAARQRDAAPLFGELIRDAMLAPRRLVDGHRYHCPVKIGGDAIAEIGFPTADLAQRLFAAGLVQVFEAVEAVAAIAHHLARWRHVRKLLSKFQYAHFGLDDLLLSRHALSMSDGQITS